MEIARTVDDVRTAVRGPRSRGKNISLVPTMGALHVGHLSLLEAARKTGGFSVVSIYVNPTQFAPSEDYQQYPRSFDPDCDACRNMGVDLVFAPSDTEIYPPGDQTRVRPGPLADGLCGPFRTGHFEGVCTIVAKLFNIVGPDIAFFGQKDAQQAVIIQRMVEDLRLPVRVEVRPTVREPDGLAMSSRNVRLSPDERKQALTLYGALCAAQDRLQSGERSIGRTVAAMRTVIAAYPEIKVDYLSIVDPATLQSVSEPAGKMLIAGAIRIGQTRLIDNIIVEVERS